MEVNNCLLVLIIGIFLGIGGAWFFSRRTAIILREQIHNRDVELAELSGLETEMENKVRDQQKDFEAKMVLVNETKELMRAEFQNLASAIMEEKSKTFTLQNKENIKIILDPLREQIGDFKKKVEDVYDKESQGRAALFNEISNLKNLNLKISEDATNLTNALKGDNKIQGNWGQVVLERILEMSGLEKGREYELQVHSHDQSGNRFFPDAVVYLPESRDAIIDSKVSLTGFEKYCSAENDVQREDALKKHIQSIKNHMNELSEKQYDKLIEVNSLDFVMMFIPIEGAYILAMRDDPSIMFEAFKKNIIIVCPSTLMSTLKIIAYTWRIQKQQKNSEEIAQKAGDLYDKLCSFLNVFIEIGEALKKSQEKFDQSLRLLSVGKGNLIKRSMEFKTLGVAGKKEIPEKLLEQFDGSSLEDGLPTTDHENDATNGGLK
jgi:DNA recombination protein RmuC